MGETLFNEDRAIEFFEQTPEGRQFIALMNGELDRR